LPAAAGGPDDGRSPDGSGVTEKSRLRRYVVRRSAATDPRGFDADRFEVVRFFADLEVPVGAFDVDVGARFVLLLRADAAAFAMRVATPMGWVANRARGWSCAAERCSGSSDTRLDITAWRDA
jgi:hypothetical protein